MTPDLAAAAEDAIKGVKQNAISQQKVRKRALRGRGQAGNRETFGWKTIEMTAGMP